MRRLFLIAGLALCFWVAATTVSSRDAGTVVRERVASQDVRPPNVLVFVTDDQTRNTVTPDVMPAVHRTMALGGTWYPNFTAADPFCCPSRASIMTGQYNHNNGVLSNDKRSVRRLAFASTIQCRLYRAGYRTGLYGKFLNNYPLRARLPCLSDHAIHSGRDHRALEFGVNGVLTKPRGYADDYALRRAVRFLRQGEQADGRPWLIYYATTFPHSPYRARPDHAGERIDAPPGTTGPARTERDSSDKPWFIQQHTGELGRMQRLVTELRMLRTVDETFARLVSALAAQGELDDTLIVFVSDNGYLFGEHHIWGKSLPYWESINVPLFIRWPGHISAGAVDERLAQNVDIAPTIADAAGLEPMRRSAFDGRSLLRAWRRDVVFNEHFQVRRGNVTPWQPTWRSLRTPTFQYIEWLDGLRGRVVEREYYDLVADPHQLENLLGDADPANDPSPWLLAALHALAVRESRCAGAGCL